MKDPTPDDRQTRLFKKALALVRDYHGTSAWSRGDGTARTSYRRYVRGLIIEWDRDTKKTLEGVDHDSVLRIRHRDSGTIFEARFDGRIADQRATPLAIVEDHRGDWEKTIEEA